MTAISPQLHQPLREFDACWHARLRRELCDICGSQGFIIRQVSFGEIYEPCPGCSKAAGDGMEKSHDRD